MLTTAPHPHNDGFIWRDRQGPFGTLAPEHVAAFDRDGWFVWRGALDPEAVAALAEVVDRIETRLAQLDRPVEAAGVLVSRPDQLSFVDHLAASVPEARAFTELAPLVGLAIDLLGPDVRVYQDHAVYKKPGTVQSFPWHQDAGYEFTIPQDYLTCWIPLNEARIDNGCVWVLSGEHRDGTRAHWPTAGGLACADGDGDGGGFPVECDPGDVLVFSALTPHRSGPNTTTATRKAYIVHYCVDGTSWTEGMADRGYAGLTCDHPTRQYLVARGGVRVAP